MGKAKRTLILSTLFTLALWYSVWSQNTSILLNKTLGKGMIKRTYPYSKVKYVLQWTKSNKEPFIYMGRGQHTFYKRHCPVTNCFITSDRYFLADIKDFDAILFHGPELSNSLALPNRRSQTQKYVFVTMKSSHLHPINHKKYDGYFNWTWTYRLNSDMYYGFIFIKNKHGDVIGPKENMQWIKHNEMQPISYKIKAKLNSKKIAAVWFVSHCYTKSKRENVAKLLQNELAKYNMTLDIYGICGTKYCSWRYMKTCLKMVESKYYFYLAFENAISEDYVTETLLNALQHYTVPIVYGGANYSRFMPDGGYLVAQTSNIKELVKQMVETINDKQKYYDFFRWTNHYSYHYGEASAETDYYCNFCKKINEASFVNEKTTYNNFQKYWNV